MHLNSLALHRARLCKGAQKDPRDESRHLRFWSSERFCPLKFAISDNEHSAIIRVFGGGFGFLHSLRVLMTPGRPHALHPHYSPPLPPSQSQPGWWGVPTLDRWVGGGEGHYRDGVGEKVGGIRLKTGDWKQDFPAPLFPLNHCSNTLCLQQHMVPVVKTELDARHQPPTPRAHHPTTNGAPAPNSLN